MLCAKLPTRAGRNFMAMPAIRSNSVAEMIRSVFLPARSRHRPRRVLSSRSNRKAPATPSASTHRVAVAWLGTTRS
ncbi:hypothetical protein D3C77_633750 [compost metagenome]